MNRQTVFIFLGLLLTTTTFAGWKTHQKKQKEIAELKQAVQEAKGNLLRQDPELASFFSEAYAYLIFPSVKKAATGIGGALGKGLVYQGGQLVGMAKLRQLSIGLQLGGQAYTEVVFFENAESYLRFQVGKVELSAQASAVALKKGAAKSGAYHEGLAIFTMTRVGLMYEASIGGQKFIFEAF